MTRKRYTGHRRLLALRACWAILRGGSVAYRVNFTGGGADGLSAPTFFAGCEIDGEPMTPWHIEHAEHADPGAQPGGERHG